MRNYTQLYEFLRVILVSTVLGFSFLGSSPVNAQPPRPVIKYVFPAGGQRGKSVEVIVSGTELQGAADVRITGGGIAAKVLKVENPNTVRATVAIAPDAELGERDLRIITPARGVSNRFRFVVGELPEITEKEPNSLKSQAQPLESLPVSINGQVLPADKDVFRFAAKAGQTLVCEVQARKLLPYIADAVPGWLEAHLTLYDAEGRELASAGRSRFDPDPVLIYNVPKDGDYFIEIRDSFYRGREDFIYKLSIGNLPYITRVFPLGGKRNSDVPVELQGANLPTKSMKLTLPGDSAPLRFVSSSHHGLNSNALPFAVSDHRETRETAPHDSFDKATLVEIPVAINGRLERSRDAQYFRFTVKGGQRFVMEVQARRLGSPLDSIITLFNSEGAQLAEQDDTDMGDPLLTHHADSRLDYTFPADGDYVVRIQDVQGGGGDAYAYRLDIAPPRPDFALRIVPENPRLGEADSAFVTVKALRKDGFNGEIDLAVQNLPKGFVASKAVIAAGQVETRLTITAPPNAPVALFSPTIVGTATLDKGAATREAGGAEDVMQAFSLRHDVPTREFLVAVIESADFTLSTNIPSTEVRDVRRESQVAVVVKTLRKGIEAEVAQAAAAKHAVEAALASLKAESAKATAGYGTAEKTAQAAEGQAAGARAAAAQAAMALANARKAAAAARPLATAAKKTRDDLLQAQKKAAGEALAILNNQVTVAAMAREAAEKTARDAETAAATAQAAADKARQTQLAAEKAAGETRALANEAKGKSDKLAADQKATVATLEQANKNLDAARTKAKQEIRLTADALPPGITFQPVNITADKSEATVTLGITPQAPLGLRQNCIITGTMGSGDNAVVHVAPAIPITILESAKVLAAAAAGKRQLAKDAKKKLDDLLLKLQKPAEARLAAAAQAVNDATTAKAAADKALAQAKEAAAQAETAHEAAERSAREAEATALAISRDAGKSAEERKKAATAAAAQRKAADAGKTTLTEARKKQQQAQTPTDTAVKTLAEAEARKKAAEQALAGVKNQLAPASRACQQAEEAAKEAEMVAAKAKSS